MQKRFSMVFVFAACLAWQGCELVADFDRSKIPTGLDGSFEGGLPEEDAGDEDGGSEDAATPIVPDAGTDAATDAAQDAAPDDDAGGDDAG